MEKDDARYSTLEHLHERRKQVVRLHCKGYKVMQIVDLCGLSYPSVRAAIDRYTVGGLAAIKPAVRGRRAGQGRALNAEQEHALRKIICDKRPEQLKMELIAKLKNHSNRPRSLGQILPKFARSDIH